MIMVAKTPWVDLTLKQLSVETELQEVCLMGRALVN
jgi:hypothetical protein